MQACRCAGAVIARGCCCCYALTYAYRGLQCVQGGPVQWGRVDAGHAVSPLSRDGTGSPPFYQNPRKSPGMVPVA